MATDDYLSKIETSPKILISPAQEKAINRDSTLEINFNFADKLSIISSIHGQQEGACVRKVNTNLLFYFLSIWTNNAC